MPPLSGTSPPLPSGSSAGTLCTPIDAFWNGFQPWVSPSNGNFPDEAFTSVTTRHRFEYEIFAYGGIDVNHVLGDGHQYANQHEIAFPGGIRREFIRTAREYSGTQLVRIWDNPRFDNELNPRGHIPPLEALPPPIRGIPVPSSSSLSTTERRTPMVAQDKMSCAAAVPPVVATISCVWLETADVDDTLSIKPIPRLSSAAVLHPLPPWTGLLLLWEPLCLSSGRARHDGRHDRVRATIC
ncbi:uncharacterized protein EV420DRAFT_1651551 [Desarmillaria tabescens]|uniref:Pierisin-like domain-containing protein n=1 Tax=Armillaria tabescens TaxID=1929756 RepID=A0AA39MLK2_ARMTA|nr:uncharacterized protein EV420DRAFT_1651551 [Desarmillaria tabescens]KAK0438169.1 hypothetical protein EV420DRAFT_1651551 [Desarmillaria tabescens]